ncbi:kinase-like domain-containing protein [Mycena polygramma]|nr:kinase-like domain-containing protein [Mycena polygramma]
MARSEDAYVFAGLEELFEEPNSYKPGGLFPVRLGDVLGPHPPRYRIFTKLGHGSYSTVWLARDLVGKRTVALKIVEAKASEGSNEAAILERLRAPPSVQPGVLQLLDSFTVESPNGVHQVLVTEIIMPLQNHFGLRLPGQEKITKPLVYQMIQGLAFMHGRGIAHGDLHPMNIGIALPELDALSERDVWDAIGAPDVEPIIAYDPTRDPASFPQYLCATINLNTFVMDEMLDLKFATRGPPQVRILDFGNAYAVENSPPPRCNTPLCVMPPEVTFPRVVDRNNAGHWDCRSDIWSLACLLHTLVSARSLFTRSLFGPQLNDSFLRMMASACGGVPEAWTNYLSASAAEFTVAAADDWWKEVGISDQAVQDVPGYLRLLRRMLVINLAERPTAEELLKDPYFDSLNDAGFGVMSDLVTAQ